MIYAMHCRLLRVRTTCPRIAAVGGVHVSMYAVSKIGCATVSVRKKVALLRACSGRQPYPASATGSCSQGSRTGQRLRAESGSHVQPGCRVASQLSTPKYHRPLTERTGHCRAKRRAYVASGGWGPLIL